MSADAETDPRGLSAIVGGDSTAGSPGGTGSPGQAGSAGEAGQGDGPLPPSAAGRLLGRLSVLPALLAMAWLLAGLPLLLAGRFTPVLMLVVSVPLAAVLCYLGLRWIPGRWQSALPRGSQRARTPWWAVAAVVAVAAAFGAHQLIYHSQQIIVERDPASYIQFGYWIAHHGSLPIPQQRAAFGGTHQLLHFGSLAFYQVAGNVVPQFMAGLPMVVAAGFWAGGVGAAVLVPPLLGACAVLTFGGLAARLAGPRWAPPAALVLALSLPEQFTSRSAYSEPLAQILFLGGLCLVIDSLMAEGRAARVLAALGGLALGLTLLVRIDGASDILPVIPYCGILLLSRRRQAAPLLGGLLAGALCGAVDGLVLSRPYLAAISSSLNPLVAAVAVVAVVTALVVVVRWRRGLPEIRSDRLPNAAAALAFLILIGLAVRPYLQPVHHRSAAQAAAHVRLNPPSVFWAMSLDWVFWYIGVPAVLLGTLGAALLARRCLRGRAPSWTLPLMVFAWIIVTVLARPAIVPNQPWASRRLVPGVLPGLILLAVWAVAWLVGVLRQHGYDRVIQAGLVTVCSVALVLPAAVTSFGLRVATGGPLGVRPVAHGLAVKRTYAGEIAAVNRMCAAIPHGSSVVIIDAQTAAWFAQVVRGMCGEPTAWTDRRPADIRQVVSAIRQAGRRPVLLGAGRSQVAPYGPAREVLALRTREDARLRTAPPLSTRPRPIAVWMTEPER
jgi:hypothetical protein